MKLRTSDEIAADLENRLAELQAEKERHDTEPETNFPCNTCRFYSTVADDGHRWSSPDNISEYATCVCPLVKGFAEYGVRIKHYSRKGPPMPCGPEKALWRPKLTRCQKITVMLGLR